MTKYIDVLARLLAVALLVFSVTVSVFMPSDAQAAGTLGVDWTEATSSADWSGRTDHASVVFNDKLWVIGGWDNTGSCGGETNSYCSDVWYSEDGIDWQLATDNPGWDARASHAVVAFDDKLWVIGGFTSSSCNGGDRRCNDVWSSSDGVTWEKVADDLGWGARYATTVTVFEGKLWLMGGARPFGGNANDIWTSEDGINWTEETSAAPWGGRAQHGSVVFDNKLWVINGWCSEGNCSDVWSSADGNTWELVTDNPAWPEREAFGLAVLDNKMWIYGGCDANCDLAKDVWSSSDGNTWELVTNDAAPGGRATWNVTSSFLQAFKGGLWVLGTYDNDWNLSNSVWHSPNSLVAEPDIDNEQNEDRNGDDIPDSEQSNVRAFTSSVSDKTVVLEADDSCTINTASMQTEATQHTVDPGFDYPDGLMSFAVDCGASGYSTTITQYYYDLPDDSFVLRKHIPTTNAYFTVTDAAIGTQTIHGQQVLSVSYEITDGGELDIDGQANGIIVDPAGLAKSVVGVPNTGLGGRSHN